MFRRQRAKRTNDDGPGAQLPLTGDEAYEQVLIDRQLAFPPAVEWAQEYAHLGTPKGVIGAVTTAMWLSGTQELAAAAVRDGDDPATLSDDAVHQLKSFLQHHIATMTFEEWETRADLVVRQLEAAGVLPWREDST